jgi:hypothetical protein
MWKSNSTSLIDTLKENKTIQVETINVNLINNCEESKDSDPDCNENKCRLSKQQKECVKSKNEDFLWN